LGVIIHAEGVLVLGSFEVEGGGDIIHAAGVRVAVPSSAPKARAFLGLVRDE
jgi:hypothetical protein